jgi:arginine deiminase
LLRVIATYVWSIHLSKVNEIMHLDMVFHCVNDGLGNSVHRMKD